MVKSNYSKTWKGSVQPRKQRKYTYNAPLHIKQKKLYVHLSPALRQKYGIRNIRVRAGDKVKVLRGQFRKKDGKVERVSLKDAKIFVAGMEYVKKEGSKVAVPLEPSNMMIVDLILDDKKRKQKLVNNKESNKENSVGKDAATTKSVSESASKEVKKTSEVKSGVTEKKEHEKNDRR